MRYTYELFHRAQRQLMDEEGQWAGMAEKSRLKLGMVPTQPYLEVMADLLILVKFLLICNEQALARTLVDAQHHSLHMLRGRGDSEEEAARLRLLYEATVPTVEGYWFEDPTGFNDITPAEAQTFMRSARQQKGQTQA